MFISMILETFSIGLILPALTLIDNPKIITEYAYLKKFIFTMVNLIIISWFYS